MSTTTSPCASYTLSITDVISKKTDTELSPSMTDYVTSPTVALKRKRKLTKEQIKEIRNCKEFKLPLNYRRVPNANGNMRKPSCVTCQTKYGVDMERKPFENSET
jgi:hypothetical protein